MSATWVQNFVHSITGELLATPTTDDIYLCDSDYVAMLRDATADILDGRLLDRHVSDQLDHLIQQAHARMSSFPRTASSWRRLYTDACILRSLVDIYSFSLTGDRGSAMSCISRLDHAIVIAGAPGERRLDLIFDMISQVQVHCLSSDKLSPVFETPSLPRYLTPITLDTVSGSVPYLASPPSLVSFISQYSRHPFVLTGYIRDWPALNEHPWSSLAYLRSIAGPGRVVPVEIGNDYRQDDWTQKMISWDEFLHAFNPVSTHESQRPPLYLAQHNLLFQFPDLRADIEVPDYAYASLPPPTDLPTYRPPGNEEQLVLNAWLGPAGTVSPAHTDPYFNFYAQVVGRKTVWLAPPDVTPSMYPYPPPSEATPDHPHDPAANSTNPSMSNTSQVDVFQHRDDRSHDMPLFWKDVVPRAMSVTLDPGDLLFFPPGWWHAMRSEETSFSVSMWF